MKLEYLLTHIFSQLCYKWVPIGIPLEDRLVNVYNVIDVFKLSLQQWEAIIKAEFNNYGNIYHWKDLYNRMFKDDGRILALNVYKHLTSVKDNGAFYITMDDAYYPVLLKEILDPPYGLTVLGDIKRLIEPQKISIVGSRKASEFALQQAVSLGFNFALQKLCVVSGGAIGCDIAAHYGVYKTKLIPANAIVVFAGGLSGLYPQRNFAIFRELYKNSAAFISERLWWMGSRAIDFPIRNRIISGLSEKLILIQASIKSGAMITANLALSQGRDVFVLIQDKDDVRFSGNLKLLQEGALGFKSAQDFFCDNFYQYIDQY